ncbi:MAG: hypothetical protein HW421_739 [Ignavibacteria bacterium]|nr:hypothetical protein [Ignavibacteria bacterium]
MNNYLKCDTNKLHNVIPANAGIPVCNISSFTTKREIIRNPEVCHSERSEESSLT